MYRCTYKNTQLCNIKFNATLSNETKIFIECLKLQQDFCNYNLCNSTFHINPATVIPLNYEDTFLSVSLKFVIPLCIIIMLLFAICLIVLNKYHNLSRYLKFLF